MSTSNPAREPEMLTCDVCLKDIPVSEARSEEALDYVLHFCGLDCYAKWKERDAPHGRASPANDFAEQGGNALPEKRIELAVVWQRLVTADGGTCARCDATRKEVERAMSMLCEVLGPLRIQPVLYTKDIDTASFRASPSESNRVWIAGTPLELWLDAQPGTSRCCHVCGYAQCRTVTLDGQVFEAIPYLLIVKAGLMAAARLLMPSKQRPGAVETA